MQPSAQEWDQYITHRMHVIEFLEHLPSRPGCFGDHSFWRSCGGWGGRCGTPQEEAWSATSVTSVWRNPSACTAGSVVHASRNLCTGRQFESSDNVRTWQSLASLLTQDARCTASHNLFLRRLVNKKSYVQRAARQKKRRWHQAQLTVIATCSKSRPTYVMSERHSR